MMHGNQASDDSSGAEGSSHDTSSAEWCDSITGQVLDAGNMRHNCKRSPHTEFKFLVPVQPWWLSLSWH